MAETAAEVVGLYFAGCRSERYTRDLPTPIAQRGINEIDADLRDHIAHERVHGISDRRLALSILSPMARGLAADASWRRRVRPRKGDP